MGHGISFHGTVQRVHPEGSIERYRVQEHGERLTKTHIQPLISMSGTQRCRRIVERR
jgi:hypothetical protein